MELTLPHTKIGHDAKGQIPHASPSTRLRFGIRPAIRLDTFTASEAKQRWIWFITVPVGVSQRPTHLRGTCSKDIDRVDPPTQTQRPERHSHKADHQAMTPASLEQGKEHRRNGTKVLAIAQPNVHCPKTALSAQRSSMPKASPHKASRFSARKVPCPRVQTSMRPPQPRGRKALAQCTKASSSPNPSSPFFDTEGSFVEHLLPPEMKS